MCDSGAGCLKSLGDGRNRPHLSPWDLIPHSKRIYQRFPEVQGRKPSPVLKWMI